MSISNVGLNQSTGSSSWRTAVQQANQDFDQLYQSLQSGNLSAAQQAYTDCVTAVPPDAALPVAADSTNAKV